MIQAGKYDLLPKQMRMLGPGACSHVYNWESPLRDSQTCSPFGTSGNFKQLILLKKHKKQTPQNNKQNKQTNKRAKTAQSLDKDGRTKDSRAEDSLSSVYVTAYVCYRRNFAYTWQVPMLLISRKYFHNEYWPVYLDCYTTNSVPHFCN